MPVLFAQLLTSGRIGEVAQTAANSRRFARSVALLWPDNPGGYLYIFFIIGIDQPYLPLLRVNIGAS